MKLIPTTLEKAKIILGMSKRNVFARLKNTDTDLKVVSIHDDNISVETKEKGKKVTSHKYFNVDLFALVSDDTQDTKLKGKLAIDKLRAMLGWFDMQDATLSDKFLTIEQMEKVFDFANEKGYEFLDNQFLNSGELEDSEIKEIQNFITEVQNNY